jgi:hypothetical protein
MPSANLHLKIIDDFLLEEKEAGRMSGPFTVEEASFIFQGHFRTAPLGLVEKNPGSANYRMIRNFSALDDSCTSTNDWLDAHKILIMWHTCYQFADCVSISSLLCYLSVTFYVVVFGQPVCSWSPCLGPSVRLPLGKPFVFGQRVLDLLYGGPQGRPCVWGHRVWTFCTVAFGASYLFLVVYQTFFGCAYAPFCIDGLIKGPLTGYM